MWDAGLWSLSHYRVKQCAAHFVTCWIYVTLILLTIVNITQTSAAAALGIIILVHWANWDSSQLTIIALRVHREDVVCVCDDAPASTAGVTRDALPGLARTCSLSLTCHELKLQHTPTLLPTDTVYFLQICHTFTWPLTAKTSYIHHFNNTEREKI